MTTTNPKQQLHQRAQNNKQQRLLPLVGSFEENVLNNRLQPIRVVEGYRAEVRAASGYFQPRPLSSNVRVSFYSAGDSFPYLSQLNIGHRGYRIPKKGTLQVVSIQKTIEKFTIKQRRAASISVQEANYRVNL